MKNELANEWRERALAKAEESGVLRAILDTLQQSADDVNSDIDLQICEEKSRIGDYPPKHQFEVSLPAYKIERMNEAICRAQEILRRGGS